VRVALGYATAVVLALTAAPPAAVGQTPDYGFLPESPIPDEQSTATDWSWDYGDGTVSVTDGSLTVIDTETGFSMYWNAPVPEPAPPSTPVPPAAPVRLLSPFPVVRLHGVLTGDRTRVVRLTIQAPPAARVTVRCGGTSCPFRRTSRIVKRELVRVRRLERSLRPGTVIEVLVSRTGRIGKYTRFVMRKGDVPKRIDLCLWPGASAGTPCPVD
jgi:hypothetical protein